MTLAEIALATAVVTIGATLQGSIGFGLGLFSVPLLVLIEPRLIPGPLLLSSIVLTLLLTHREWHAIRFGDLKWALLGRAGGIALAALALTLVPSEQIAILFGILVLAAVSLSASGVHVAVRANTLLGAGLLAGFMGTTVSIGGPPMALLYQRETGARIRGTLSAFFVVGVGMSVVALHLIGRFGRPEARLASLLVPGILLGFLVSRHTARTLDRGYVRTAVLVVSGITGLVVLVRNIV